MNRTISGQILLLWQNLLAYNNSKTESAATETAATTEADTDTAEVDLSDIIPDETVTLNVAAPPESPGAATAHLPVRPPGFSAPDMPPRAVQSMQAALRHAKAAPTSEDRSPSF